MNKNNANEIIIYQTDNGQTQLEVNLKEDTVWLSQMQMTELFGRDQSVISRHLRNVFKENELEEKSNMQKMHIPNSDRPVAFYSLDVIISIGYRVKSLRGTQFRIWATNVLKEHLIKGYTSNNKRLHELQKTIKLVEKVVNHKKVSSDEAQSLLKVIADYSYALGILDDYDHQRQIKGDISTIKVKPIAYDEAIFAINEMRKKYGAPELFGKEKDESLKSSLQTIFQTFEGKDLYPSLEEKSANILYFLVKNHSFIDGNKRIAAFIFVWFLDRNGFLYNKEDGSKRIADNALVAITLMIAESNPDERETIVNVIVNLINSRNQ